VRTHLGSGINLGDRSDPTINGNFNLYAEGKVKQDRDAMKLSKLQSLIEVKSDPTKAEAIDDIVKLDEWRTLSHLRAEKDGITCNSFYQFVVFNAADEVIEVATKKSDELKVDVRFIAN